MSPIPTHGWFTNAHATPSSYLRAVHSADKFLSEPWCRMLVLLLSHGGVIPQEGGGSCSGHLRMTHFSHILRFVLSTKMPSSPKSSTLFG